MMKIAICCAAILLVVLGGGNANSVPSHSTDAKTDRLPAGKPFVPRTVHSESDSVIGESVATNCPTGYSQPANQNWTSCYKVYNNYKNRNDAAAQCHRDNGTLASVPNGFVNAYLYSLATNTVPQASSLWLGIQCFSGQNSCINDDGTPFNYNSFNMGQPTAQDICIYMSTIGRDSQKWSTFDCEQSFQFACEVNVKKQNQNLVCPQGYLSYQGMCYATILDPNDGLTFDQQVTKCRAQPGGDLATITSDQMENFLISNMPYTCSSQYLVRMGLRCTNVQYDGDTRSCVWNDGTPFSFNNFSGGNPGMGSSNVCNAYSASQVDHTWYSRDCDINFHCYTCQSTGL